MKITSPDIQEGRPIPPHCAFGIPHPEDHVGFGANQNPGVAWEELPEGTRSLAVTLVDHDVPTRPDDVNEEGREVPADLPRSDFVHWVLIDVAPDRDAIATGEFAEGVVARGKDGVQDGPREGVNDYTGWFVGDPDMEGTYCGYDGPCPPWNDSLVHHYELTVYALDVPALAVPDRFTIEDAREAMGGHVLAEESVTGTYALNPRLL